MRNRMRLGDLLISVGKLSQDQLENALKVQKATGKKLGELLVDEGYVTERDIIQVLEFQYGIPHVDLEKYFIDSNVAKSISEKLARKHILIPINIDRGKIVVSMADPLNIFAIDDIKMVTGMDVKPVISTRLNILNAIDKYYGKETAENAVKEFTEQKHIEDIEDINEELISDINNSPVVRLVNSIISQAVKAKASDIHIEPYENTLRIRFRIDGDLHEIMSPTKSAHSAIITRIKIMSNMDIAERRIPQDGRIEMKIDGVEIDLRISIIPTVFGEKVVIRLLDRSSFLMSKEKLGFTKQNLEKFDNIINSPNGIILVTGPTGSGKTTTLYTSLRELNTIDKNIVTIEDPVEYRLDGINQTQVNTKTGMTFASGLRSILRQDPDIIMIGEIRDDETAQIAVRAAITGHLVISTMHTNDAPSTIARLRDMGVEPYLISSSIIGIIAQRLIKRICDGCKISYEPSEVEKKLLNVDNDFKLHKGKGCSRCNETGYKGRIAIHEVMSITNDIKNLIDEKDSSTAIKDKAKENGLKTIEDNCKELVIKGITTIEELNKVIYYI